MKNLFRFSLVFAVVGFLALQPLHVSAQTTVDPEPDLIGDNEPIVELELNLLGPLSHPYGRCHPRAVRHWDKIIFKVMNTETAQRLKVRAFSELDIKVLDNPRTVADLREKVVIFLLRRVGVLINRENVEAHIRAIKIVDVDYAIVCSGSRFTLPLPLPLAVETPLP
jgi:hypothetical protein